MYQGLYTNRLPPVPFKCSSGECRFPYQYHSTGACSKCIDVTDQIRITRIVEMPLMLTNISDSQQSVEHGSNTTFHLPYGLKTTSLSPFLVDVSATIGPSDSVSAAMGREGPIPNLPDMYNSITLSVLLGLFINRSEASKFESESLPCHRPDMWGCRGSGAAECSLYPCVRTFQAVIHTGVLSDTVVSEATAWGCPMDSSLCSTVNVACLTDAERKTLLSKGYTFKPGDPWMPYNLSDYAQSAYDRSKSLEGPSLNDPNLLDDVTDIRPECIYQVSQVEWYYLFLYMASHFSELRGDTTTTMGLQTMLNNVFYEGGNISTASIEKRFTRMARAMSVAYQEMGTSAMAVGNSSGFHNTSSTSWVTGEGLRNDTCVSVQWPWIAYPAVLSVATLVFLVLTVAHTSWRRGGAAPELASHDYKTSVVPLLLHGLYHEDGDELERRPYESVEMVKDKMKRTRKIHVRFEHTPVGWRLVERGRGVEKRKTGWPSSFSFGWRG